MANPQCPACEIEMEKLVEGIYQCPQCRKISKQKVEKKEEKEEKIVEKGEFQDGEYFHQNAGLNQKYEICDKGITIDKSPNRWLAVLLCHSAYLSSERYIRISFWKKSFYRHAGMMKIYDQDVLNNLIQALEKIDKNFDEFWTFKGKYRETKEKTEEQKERERKLDLIKYRIIENRTCPKCQKKMDKNKSYYECKSCGEIVILEGYNQPVFNIEAKDLNLDFQTNFPINFYLPSAGITIKWLMGEWKALVVIYSKENPNKKWLRFYWWNRDLKNILKYGSRDVRDEQFGWNAKKGSGSTNLYDKAKIKPLIEALEKAGEEMGWKVKHLEEEDNE